ncbi:MAG: ATP-binding protein, partial [Patescibacteria group bacterium]|nr:ATP-binding protein [Patescibacteria group bacterium]
SYGFWRLFKKYIQTQGIERSQIIYLLLGCVLAANLAFITNLFMPWFNRTELNWLGQIFTLFMVGFAAYAIVVHRLMDIKFVLRRSSVYLISLSTVLILATPIEYIFNRYFIDITAWADLAILILALSIFPPIKRYYYRSANKYFFASLYDSGEVIAKLSDKLRSTLELNRICEFISSALMNAFHTEALGILIYNEKTKSYTVSRNTGFNISRIKKTIKEEQLYKLCAQQNEPIIVEELKRSSYQQYKQIIDLLTDLKIETVTPLNIKDKTIGIVIAGIKESGDMYNDEDLKVLKVISAQAAIAIENALLYKETKNFAIKLKKEVKKATAELRVANKKLKKLDAAKSEFISIASHQLRTPLTIIKGYISMMLEGAFGQLSEQELSPLEKVYESNERLIQLVENLLNISRIESGRLQFNFTIMRLEDIVGSVIEEMANSAKKKGLRLDYKKPGKPLPGIKIDEEKIRQVIINLIDNAIKYTKQGGITVSLSSAPSAVAALGADNAIQFCASDTGMGVSQEDLPNLFKKFSRGKGVSTVHTEGTGLGLYVSKMMIEAHQGKIWCESEGKGRGSRFCFKLGAG